MRFVGLFVWFRWWQTAFGDHLLDEFTAIATFVHDGLGDRLSDATKWQLLEVQGVPSQARLFAQSDNTWSTVVGYLQNKEHIFGNNPPYNNVNPVGCSLVWASHQHGDDSQFVCHSSKPSCKAVQGALAGAWHGTTRHQAPPWARPPRSPAVVAQRQ